MLTIRTGELFQTIKSGNIEKVEQLVNSNPELVTSTNPDGVTGIMYALYTGHPQIARLLSNKKRNLDFFEASSLGELDTVKRMIGKEPAKASSFSSDGFSALSLAAHFGQRVVVEYLIDNGAEINAVAQNPTRFTALTGALSNNHSDIAKILVNKGADVNYRYEQGFSPLMLAVENGNLEMTRFLLEHGSDVNAKTNDGKTALTYALEKGHQEVAALLKQHRATE